MVFLCHVFKRTCVVFLPLLFNFLPTRHGRLAANRYRLTTSEPEPDDGYTADRDEARRTRRSLSTSSSRSRSEIRRARSASSPPVSSGFPRASVVSSSSSSMRSPGSMIFPDASSPKSKAPAVERKLDRLIRSVNRR